MCVQSVNLSNCIMFRLRAHKPIRHTLDHFAYLRVFAYPFRCDKYIHSCHSHFFRFLGFVALRFRSASSNSSLETRNAAFMAVSKFLTACGPSIKSGFIFGLPMSPATHPLRRSSSAFLSVNLAFASLYLSTSSQILATSEVITSRS